MMGSSLNGVYAGIGTTNIKSTTPPAIQPPVVVVPPTLRVSSAKSKSVTLKWGKATGANYYQIYSKTGKGKWHKLKTLKGSKTKFTKKTLSIKRTYTYKIRAKVSGKWTEFSPVVKKVKVRGKYSQPTMYGSVLNKKELLKIRDKVANFVNKNQTWRLTQAEKADLAAVYIATTIEYRGWSDSKYYNTAYGGLIKKKGACSAYMRAYKALADGMGIKCKCVHTNVTYTAHQWCHVKVDGKWYILETQYASWMGRVKKSNKKSNDIYRNYYVMKR
jgi:transglutaminase/protease-like cytokinesis protein 3